VPGNASGRSPRWRDPVFRIELTGVLLLLSLWNRRNELRTIADLERVSVSRRLHLVPTDRRCWPPMETPTGIPRLLIQIVYRQGVILKTWYPVAVLPNGVEVPCLSTTALVLRVPRSFDGKGCL